MRILYGVVGEGMGHAIRSRVILQRLIAQGHEVEIIASSRAADFLGQRFDNVHRIHGMHILYGDNSVRRGQTVVSNVLAGTAAFPKQVRAYFDLVEDFKPEVVISDFESWTHLYAKMHRIPVISLDNMQVINRCQHDPEVLAGIRTEFELARMFVKGKLPGCAHYLVTSFFRPPLRRKRTTLVPPILRDEVLSAESTGGEHLLVYQTAEGHNSMVPILQACGVPCRVYGMRREITEDVVDGNLTYRPFDETGFIDDLRSARAVLAGGGFTLLGEAVYLHKPVLSVPIAGQAEQVLNARYIEREGYGMGVSGVDEDNLAAFLRAVPRYAEALSGYVQDGNRETFEALDHQLDQAAAGLLRL